MSSSIDVIKYLARTDPTKSTHATPILFAASVPAASTYHQDYPSALNKKEINEGQIAELATQGFTKGLAVALGENCDVFPVRFWVIDNSGSMNTADGHRVVETTTRDNVAIVPCTRWEEIKECVNYHAQMAALLCAPTVFRVRLAKNLRVSYGFLPKRSLLIFLFHSCPGPSHFLLKASQQSRRESRGTRIHGSRRI